MALLNDCDNLLCFLPWFGAIYQLVLLPVFNKLFLTLPSTLPNHLTPRTPTQPLPSINQPDMVILMTQQHLDIDCQHMLLVYA